MSSMNFTCDVCGREVFSCTFVNGMKFCAKCYQETFGETEKDRKITDLEAKLSECEKKFIVANNLRKNADEVLLNYKTEKYGLDKTIQELRKMKLSLPEKEWYYKGFENCERQMSSHIADLTLEVKELKQQLAECEKKNFELVAKINLKEHKPAFCTLADRDCEALWQVEELQKQLSEKDKEYQSFKKIADENVNYLKNRILEETRNYNQDKILFAVEKLEKVKETTECVLDNALKNSSLNQSYYDRLLDEIDNQIKHLKEKE